VQHGEGVADDAVAGGGCAGAAVPVLAQLLAEGVLPAVGEQVGHVDLVDDEQQDDEAAGHQQLAERAGEGPPAIAATGCVAVHVRPPLLRRAPCPATDGDARSHDGRNTGATRALSREEDPGRGECG
jgi:hypothetical protein